MEQATSSRREQGHETRERILAHAVQLASSEGLQSLTIGRLATDLEMSKSGLFGHFGSKEDLQLATIESGAEIFSQSIIRPAFAHSVDGSRLHALAYGFIDYLEGAVFDGGCFWGSVSAEFDNRPGPVRDKIREKLGYWTGLLEDQAKQSGADDPRQIAFELHALGQGANSEFQLFGDAAVFARARLAIAGVLTRIGASPG